ncbi:hypothetical protein DEIPH_ctg044orf0100 [Deinococcus phoenicis]|uniref:Uncharacterized protein n=1 Tax=Deinococcus phoenicis TaxID=1476583 RepID=A0A016QMJ3_9DEIO|nr:hypothetical protein [Deinococcus phoenicis]EYB67370.1 hypothetical protein DEIPH_ctg044orf0100 [Deinococcus phoenicis]
MKKILMLTAFALAGLAAAQDTTTPTTPPAETTTPADTGTTTTDTSTTETSTTTTSTGTAGTTMQDMNMANPASMSATDNFARAQEFAVQADVAYPVPFYDRTLWKAAVDSAYYAASMDAGNRDYQAYLAQLYTKTQWWINAYNAWNRLGTLNDTEKQWASLSAAKLAYIALQRGDKQMARMYVEKGMSWADSASLQAIMKRL